MKLRHPLFLALLLSLPACGGDAGSGAEEGGGGPAPLAPVRLEHKTVTAEYRLVMQAPEGSKAEWNNPYFFVSHPGDFAVRVVPRWSEDLAKKKEGYGALNIEGFTVLVDEPDALLVEVRAYSGTDYEVYVNRKVGDVEFALSSTELVGGAYTREQAERILECCRTLAAAE